MKNQNSINTKKLVTLAMFAAISVVLVTFIHFPLPLLPAFLEYDPADIPIFIATFLFGPWWGLAITIVTSVIQGVTVSALSGIIGIVMHIAATGSFVIVFGLICRHKHSMFSKITAIICGIITMTAVMVVMNLLFTPVFMETSVDIVLDMILPAILPFNLLKSTLNAAAAFMLFLALEKPAAKFNLIDTL